MTKVDEYRQALRRTDDWDEYLVRESRLPGPRANIELAEAAAEEGDYQWFSYLLTFDAAVAPTNSPEEFLAFCGTLGMGRLLAEGNQELIGTLRNCASDPRWRMREAVAMALQRYGSADMNALLAEMESWAEGTPLERRAAAAGLCHPELLTEPETAERVLLLLDRITASLLNEPNRHSDECKALVKALGYCWSVAACAHPQSGKIFMEDWMSVDDDGIRRIMKLNLKKKRLERIEPEWTSQWLEDLS